MVQSTVLRSVQLPAELVTVTDTPKSESFSS